MKNILALLFLLSALAPAARCGDPAADKKLKVGLCMANLDAFLGSLADAAVQRAVEEGVGLIILDAQDNDAKQLEQVSIVLDSGIDALVLNPTSTAGSGQIVAAAASLGAP